jgi:hypothetical protein
MNKNSNVWRCPGDKAGPCGSTAFHIDDEGGKLYLKCWAPKKCDYRRRILIIDAGLK